MSPQLVRDGFTRAGYTCLAGWGWFIYGFGTTLPLLRDEQQVSSTVVALHSIALSAGSLVSGAAAVATVTRVGRRGSLLGGAGLLLVGTLLLVLAPSVPVSLPAALVAGIGGSLMVNTVNSGLTEHHGAAGASAMSEGAALASAAGLLAPLAIGACTALGLTWRPAMALSMVFALVAVLLVGRVPVGTAGLDGLPTRFHTDDPATLAGGPLPTRFWPVALVLVVCVGVEFSLVTWAPDLLRQEAGMAAGPASVAVTAIVAGMLVGRLLIGRLARRRSPSGLLMAALGLTAVGWLVTWTTSAPVLAMTGLALTGLGAGGHYPLAATLALDLAAGRRDRASGVLSIGIGVSAGAGPFGLAALADRTSTHTAFLVVPALLAVAAALLAWSLSGAGGSGDRVSDPLPATG